VLSDRIKIANAGMGPEVVLARQVVLNCGLEDPKVIAGNCSGGTAEGYFQWVGKYGIPDDTCQEYDALDHECSAVRTCMNCQRTPQADGTLKNDCYPVQRYAKWFVSEWGVMQMPSVFEMQAEIYARGPIACIMASGWIEHGKYKPGMIIDVANKTWEFDHQVSPVGWGVQSGAHGPVSYWIVRNSWGTFWGDNGWFRVKQGINSMGIETECTWAVPSSPVLDDYGPNEPADRIFPSVPMDATLLAKDGSLAEELDPQKIHRAWWGCAAVALVGLSTAMVVKTFARRRAMNIEVGSEALLRA